MKKVLLMVSLLFSMVLVGCETEDDKVNEAIGIYSQYIEDISIVANDYYGSANFYQLQRMINDIDNLSKDINEIYKELDDDSEASEVVKYILDAAEAIDEYLINSFNDYGDEDLLQNALRHTHDAEFYYEKYYDDECDELLDIIESLEEDIIPYL